MRLGKPLDVLHGNRHAVFLGHGFTQRTRALNDLGSCGEVDHAVKRMLEKMMVSAERGPRASAGDTKPRDRNASTKWPPSG